MRAVWAVLVAMATPGADGGDREPPPVQLGPSRWHQQVQPPPPVRDESPEEPELEEPDPDQPELQDPGRPDPELPRRTRRRERPRDGRPPRAIGATYAEKRLAFEPNLDDVAFHSHSGSPTAIYVSNDRGFVMASCDGAATWNTFEVDPTVDQHAIDSALVNWWKSPVLGLGGGLSFSTNRIYGLQGSAPDCLIVDDLCPFAPAFRRHGFTGRSVTSVTLPSGDVSFVVNIDAPPPAPRPPSMQLSVDEDDPHRATLTKGDEIYETRDCGQTWWPTFEPPGEGTAGDAPAPKDGADRAPGEPIFRVEGVAVQRSLDGGASWEDVPFEPPHPLRDLALDPLDDDHWLGVGGPYAWETFDAGTTWRPIFVSDVEPARAFVDRDGTPWIVTRREVFRLGAEASVQPDPQGLLRFRQRLAVEPSLAESIDRAQRTLGVHLEVIGDRREIRKRGLLPRVGVGIIAFRPNAFTRLSSADRYSDAWIGIPGLDPLAPPAHPDSARITDEALAQRRLECQDENDPDTCQVVWVGRETLSEDFILERTFRAVHFFIGFVAQWDTDELLISGAEITLVNHIENTQRDRRRVADVVRNLYAARRTALLHLLARPPADLASRHQLHLQVEEMTAQLNGLGDGLWDEALKWLQHYQREPS